MRTIRIRLRIRLIGSLVSFLVWAAPGAPLGAAQLNPETVVFDRCPDLAQVLGSPGGMSSLLNPVFRTRAEIDAALSPRRALLSCMNSIRYETIQPLWFGSVREGLELYVSFAEAPEGALELIDLAAIGDRAVRTLREDVGLRAPEGVVFVRYYPSRDVLPPLLAPAFDSPDTRAVTVGPRFVAVLTESALTGASRRRALESTLSHELVHAFLNAPLDWAADGPAYPAWFHEGMAIHFSLSGRAHVGVGSGGFVRVAPTDEYESYERSFLYLEETLGREAFYRSIRAAVSGRDADVLLRSAGVDSYDALARDAGLWLRWWPMPPGLIQGPYAWVVGGAIAVGLFFGLRAWRRWEPAVPNSSLETELNADLVTAVWETDLGEVSDLLRSGADPNARDAAGCPVLVRAVRARRADLVERLLDQGARVDADVRQAAVEADDPDIDRLVADAGARWREVW